MKVHSPQRLRLSSYPKAGPAEGGTEVCDIPQLFGIAFIIRKSGKGMECLAACVYIQTFICRIASMKRRQSRRHANHLSPNTFSCMGTVLIHRTSIDTHGQVMMRMEGDQSWEAKTQLVMVCMILSCNVYWCVACILIAWV